MTCQQLRPLLHGHTSVITVSRNCVPRRVSPRRRGAPYRPHGALLTTAAQPCKRGTEETAGRERVDRRVDAEFTAHLSNGSRVVVLAHVGAQISVPAADPHQPTLERLKQTRAGQDSSPLCHPRSPNECWTQSLLPFWRGSPARAPAPAREERGSAHRGRRGHGGRAHRSRPRSGRLNLPPARAPRAGHDRHGGGGAARPSLGRGGARPAPERPGAGATRAPTRAFLPPGFTCGRPRAPLGRAGNKPRSAADARAPTVAVPRAALRPDPPPVTAATYLAAGRPQGTPPLAGPAANCPRACALQASGPDPGPERKTKSPAAPGGRPGKCKWRALAGELLTRLSPSSPGCTGCVFWRLQTGTSGLTTRKTA